MLPSLYAESGFMLSDQGFDTNVSDKLYYFSTEEELTIEDVVKKDTKWNKNHFQHFQHGYSKNIFWFRLHLKNLSEYDKFYLVINNTRLDYVDFYYSHFYENNHQKWLKKISGDKRPYLKEQEHANPEISFVLPRDASQYVYFQIKSRSTLSFSANIYNDKTHTAMNYQRKLIQGLYFFLLCFYIAFQVYFNKKIKGKEKYYLSGFVIMVSAYCFCFYGDANRLLWPNWIYAKNTFYFCFGLLGGFFLVNFIKDFLLISRLSRRVYVSIQIYNFYIICAIIYVLFGSSVFVQGLLLSIAAINAYVIMCLGVYFALKKGVTGVLFIAVSWVISGIAMMLLMASIYHFIPYNYFTSHAFLMLLPIDCLLLTASIYYRYQKLTDDLTLLNDQFTESKQENLSWQRQARVQDQKIQELQASILDKNNPQSRLSIPEEKKDSEDPFLTRCMIFIQSNYQDPQLNVSVLAEQLCVSERQLYRKLKSLVNKTPNEILLDFRLEKGRELIHQGERVGITALTIGFSSPELFSKHYKKKYGVSPSKDQL